MIKVYLDDILKEKNITSKQLSKQINITEANLSILRTGRAKAIRFTTLSAICKSLNCQPGDILKYEEVNMISFTVEKNQGRYLIMDEDKNLLLNTRSEERKTEILDINGIILADIKKKRVMMLPADLPVFEVKFKDGQKFEIRKEIKNLKSVYEITGMQIKTDKSIFDKSFRIDMKQTFANIRRQEDKFFVEVEEEECIHKFAAFVIAIFMIMEFENIK